MGQLKDSLQGARGHLRLRTGRMEWEDVSPRRPCWVCGGISWCQVSRESGNALCKRTAEGSFRTLTNGEGIECYLHFADGRAPERPRDEHRAGEGNSERAGAEVRDAVYRALLARLPLNASHRTGLVVRGFAPEHIDAGGYRSLGLPGRSRLARELLDAGHVLDGVPGFYVAEGERGPYWTLGGSPGRLVPVRDLEGRIVSLKVRRDDAGEGPKYLALSSRSRGGPSAENAAHFPVFAAREAGRPLFITEGELKADASTVLAGVNVLSIPGVGAWRTALPLVRALAPSRAIVALDADADTNPNVARAQRELFDALRAEGFCAAIKRWNASEGKGLDDLLLTRRRPADATRNP